MAAYVIFMREKTTDEQELKLYSELALPTLSNRPATPLAFYGALDVLEGPAFEGAALHRRQGASYRVFIVEGSSPA
jgi:uncharacterized protein (DUF1330 family)